MSRSVRRSPVVAVTTAVTEKRFKVREHRRERRAVRVALAGGGVVPDRRGFGDPWDGEKDGKRWVEGGGGRLLRK